MSFALVKKTTLRPTTVSVRCESNKHKGFHAKFNAFIEKKKELDRSRWEKLKEASRVIDHIGKSDVKETIDILKSLAPKQTKTTTEDFETDVEKTTDETTTP